MHLLSDWVWAIGKLENIKGECEVSDLKQDLRVGGTVGAKAVKKQFGLGIGREQGFCLQ